LAEEARVTEEKRLADYADWEDPEFTGIPFRSVDVNGDGKLDRNDYWQAMDSISVNYEEIDELSD